LKHTPLFSRMISCLAMILGASNDSGHGPGLHAWAKLAVFSPGQERFVGQCREGLRDSRSGLIMGDFESCLLLPTGLGVAGSSSQSGSFFPDHRFCPGWIMGLFSWDGRVIGLAGLFRSPWISLAISVKDGESRNRGLRFGIRVDYGRIRPSCGWLCA
jgi:hypothetical protein